MIKVNSYDIDGVIYMGEYHDGLKPGPEDIIVTGRSYEERDQTLVMLRGRGIHNMVFFNPLSRNDPKYGRAASGSHKARIFNELYKLGVQVDIHFEDDPLQIEMVEVDSPWVNVIKVGNEEWT